MIKILDVKPCSICSDIITIENSGNSYVITLGHKEDLRLPVCIYIINLYLEYEIELSINSK